MPNAYHHSPRRFAAPPAWFRYALVAIATLVMCSCQTAGPKYRVADQADATLADASKASALPPVLRESPETVAPRPAPRYADAQLTQAVAELPTAPRPPLLSDRTAFTTRASQDAAMSVVSYNARQIPTHLTQAQIQQATCPPEGCQLPTCGPGCPCCSNDGVCGPDDEWLCDGGDLGLPAAVVKSGAITGLEQEDAVAHYDTVDGRTIITPSNKVCIYAPKFAAVREVVDVRAYERIDAPKGAILDQPPVTIDEPELPSTTLAGLKPKIDRLREPPSLMQKREQAGEVGREERAAVVLGSLAPYCNLEVVRTGEIIGEDRVKIARSSLAAITWAADQAAQVVLENQRAHAEVSVQTPGTIYLLVEPNNPKLRLIKLASKCSAQLGEEVEFTLRFDNIGDRVIGNVTIVDHLTTRLEYVPQSQKSTLKAEFKTEPESNDSLTLRWEIAEPLQPGEGGVLQFRTKVR